MSIKYLFISLSLIISFIACDNKVHTSTISASDSISTLKSDDTIKVLQRDTALIKNKVYVLSVYKNDTTSYFKVEKSFGSKFKTILIDSDYTLNNSDLFFKDENKDGYLDIVWTKKWQDHSYLYNPTLENFIEVGEFHDIDTLKVYGKTVFYKDKYPLLYLLNKEKDYGWMTEIHSELFVIDDNYRKISFATIDNFASNEDWNADKCIKTKSVVINCYVPPYIPRYGELSIWNSGKSIDSFNLKKDKFDSAFIIKYWTKNYYKLIPFGKEFHVRRETELKYIN